MAGSWSAFSLEKSCRFGYSCRYSLQGQQSPQGLSPTSRWPSHRETKKSYEMLQNAKDDAHIRLSAAVDAVCRGFRHHRYHLNFHQFWNKLKVSRTNKVAAKYQVFQQSVQRIGFDAVCSPLMSSTKIEMPKECNH